MSKFRAWNQIDSEYINEINAVMSLDGSHIWWDINDSGEMKYEDDPENYKLEQFTGLKDVNGKDIYEGDIIITHPKYDGEQSNCGVVQYGCSRRPEFSYKSKNGAYMSIWSSNAYRTYEVIGNVHENPELS